MSIEGPPDNPPDEDSEGIRYFDFSEPFEPVEPETDPFEAEDPTSRKAMDERDRPKLALVRGDEARQGPERKAARPSTRDAFEFALKDSLTHTASGGHGDEASGTAFAPLTTYFERGGAVSQRARFVDAFDAARAQVERPFVAVALRMSPDDPASAWFPLVEQGIRSAMRSSDTLLVNQERLRLAAVLPGRSEDDVRPLLADLMTYLREHVENAAEVGHRISVLAAPEGRPFPDGATFLTDVYDKP